MSIGTLTEHLTVSLKSGLRILESLTRAAVTVIVTSCKNQPRLATVAVKTKVTMCLEAICLTVIVKSIHEVTSAPTVESTQICQLSFKARARTLGTRTTSRDLEFAQSKACSIRLTKLCRWIIKDPRRRKSFTSGISIESLLKRKRSVSVKPRLLGI